MRLKWSEGKDEERKEKRKNRRERKGGEEDL
jgi:hypothetical protein